MCIYIYWFLFLYNQFYIYIHLGIYIYLFFCCTNLDIYIASFARHLHGYIASSKIRDTVLSALHFKTL